MFSLSTELITRGNLATDSSLRSPRSPSICIENIKFPRETIGRRPLDRNISVV